MEQSERAEIVSEVWFVVLVVGVLLHSTAVTIWPNSNVVPGDSVRRWAELPGYGFVWGLVLFSVVLGMESKVDSRAKRLMALGTVAAVVIALLHFAQSWNVVATLDFPTSSVKVSARPLWVVSIQAVALPTAVVALIGAVRRMRGPRWHSDALA